MTNPDLTDRLASGAAGYRPAEAAIYIITTTVNGTLPAKLTPAVDDEPNTGRAWIDWQRALDISTPFSSGERRLIALAASLHEGHLISLADTLAGLDDANAHHLVTAFAHALGVDR